jgi:hypothetical protein
MTTKITIGLQQKVGQPNFGSLGASCSIELNLSDEQTRHPSLISDHIREAFAQCRDSIRAELAGAAEPADSQRRNDPPPPPRSTGGDSSRTATPKRSATEAQIRAIHAIAGKQGIVVASELAERFGVQSPAQLSIRQASEFIDSLKSVTAS